MKDALFKMGDVTDGLGKNTTGAGEGDVDIYVKGLLLSVYVGGKPCGRCNNNWEKLKGFH